MISQTTATHATLLARLSDGDAVAWSDFCDRYEQLIRGFAKRQGLGGADADDVVQDVLLGLTKSMPGFRYDPAKGKFRSYLKTATMHAIWRRSRQKGPVVPLGEGGSQADGADDPVDQTWEIEWRQYHLRQAMRTIRAEFNASDVIAFERYVGADRDAKETAAELGLSVDSVYQAKSRILRRLGQVIATQTDEEG